MKDELIAAVEEQINVLRLVGINHLSLHGVKYKKIRSYFTAKGYTVNTISMQYDYYVEITW